MPGHAERGLGHERRTENNSAGDTYHSSRDVILRTLRWTQAREFYERVLGFTYSAGDVVTWRLPGGLPHIGIVSPNRTGARPLIIHNIGAGAMEDDVLFTDPITGHFRYPSVAPDPRLSWTPSASPSSRAPLGEAADEPFYEILSSGASPVELEEFRNAEIRRAADSVRGCRPDSEGRRYVGEPSVLSRCAGIPECGVGQRRFHARQAR